MRLIETRSNIDYCRQEEIDEDEVRSIFGKTEDGKYAKRIKDEDDNDEAIDLDEDMKNELKAIPK